jgi:NAD(P)-dependent dehydrogenase (short-subunit alcohol dehydrogenase family)
MSDDLELTGRRALVTGGTQGKGKLWCRGCAKPG